MARSFVTSSRVVHLPVAYFYEMCCVVTTACGREYDHEAPDSISYDSIHDVTCKACLSRLHRADSRVLKNWAVNNEDACHDRLASQLNSIA